MVSKEEGHLNSRRKEDVPKTSAVRVDVIEAQIGSMEGRTVEMVDLCIVLIQAMHSSSCMTTASNPHGT